MFSNFFSDKIERNFNPGPASGILINKFPTIIELIYQINHLQFNFNGLMLKDSAFLDNNFTLMAQFWLQHNFCGFDAILAVFAPSVLSTMAQKMIWKQQNVQTH